MQPKVGSLKMTSDSLFERLDLDQGGKVSRSELHTAAKRMGWHWHDTPIFALLESIIKAGISGLLWI
jgi:hypothetical protein